MGSGIILLKGYQLNLPNYIFEKIKVYDNNNNNNKRNDVLSFPFHIQ